MQDVNIMNFMSAIVKIRNAADRISVSGRENRELINFIYANCNELLKQLEIIMNKQLSGKEAPSDDADKDA